MTEIEAAELSSGYYGREVLHGISISITKPGIYIVLGKNGAGKTTFFRTITGILKPYTGTLTIDGIDPYYHPEIREKCVYLSHQAGVPVTLDVSQIIELFAKLMDASEEDKARTVKMLGLQDLLERSYVSLSQGQKKRVSLAKVLLRDRSIYLFDEPTTNLDPTVASDVRKDILNISKDKIVLYSSHNLYEAREIGKQVIIIDNGKLAYNGDIDKIPMGKYVIGIRADDISSVFPEAKLEGRYYILELESPDEVPAVIRKLADSKIKVLEIREMSNPLEDLLR
ncbi:MAG TPA: ABC transporter ATP-binding protein [Thermoplasmataceae archaeon]|nr:ABC transporter ATP-binding protein [Thermoplasmatales archaeon AK]HLH85779.1 ABC transporter ATP-binding protein [Thermoplasmataceae archaeon]